jgi:hypothetical protein
MFASWTTIVLLAGPPAARAADHEPQPSTASHQQEPSAVNPQDDLDTRTPVFLLPMMAEHQKEQMRDHLRAIQQIIEATSRESWDEVAAAAERIGYSKSMAAMCEHMGAATPGFAETALAFHKTADRIADAARAKSAAEVLAATGATLAVCTGCHATYKQRVVDADEWRRLTGTDAPAPGSHPRP